MCQLQSTTFACGHPRKTLLQACPFAQRLAPIPGNPAPSFCLNGLNIAESTTSDEACGRSHKDDPCSCTEIVVLKPFFDREAAICMEFDKYMHRVRRIAECLASGERPECNWESVTKDGLDIGELQCQQEVFWSQTLPNRLDEVYTLLVEVSNQLAIASAYAIDAILQTRLGRPASNDLPALVDDA